MPPEWVDSMDRYSISYPFGDSLRAIKINEDDVDEELLETCVENFIVSEVAEGYYITHENIEKHLDVIVKTGLEPYLEKRLKKVADGE